MNWDNLLQWITDHQDALTWLFGSGVVGAIIGGLYKLVRWLVEVRRERQRGSRELPFVVIPPGGDVLAVALPDDLPGSPLNDRHIPYIERLPGRNVRREMETLLVEQRALLVCGKSGLGKTREAAHLAQMLNKEGWTVLWLRPDAWLEPPARRLEGVPTHKLLLFLDDLSRRCAGGRREINPRADSLAQPLTLPFQQRLLKTLEAFEAFYGKDEILVLATTRSETVGEQEGEPAEWQKLEWERYPDLWERFARYDLPEPDPEVAARWLAELGAAAEVRVEEPATLARRNDGTLRNLVENLRTVANPERGSPALTPANFRDTLRGTWQDRCRRACERYPEARFLYWAARALRQYDFPLKGYTLLPLARDLMGRASFWQKQVRLRRALRYLVRYEGIANPRDGQLEAAGSPAANEKTVTDSLIRIGLRHRLADALDSLADALIWPADASEPVHHPDAVRILRQVTAWLPEDQGPWLRLGVALRLAGRHDEAIAAYRKAIELDPKYAAAWNNLGYTYHALGRHDEAVAAYRKAIELDPKYAAAWYNLGIVYGKLGRHDEAIAAYLKAIELDPKYARAWNNLGYLYDDLGRHDEAVAAYLKAIELDPKYAFPHGNLADLYVTLGRLEEARREFEERIRLHLQNTFWPRVALGILARHQGLPDSEDHFRQALAQWDTAWQQRLQSPASLLETKALALLCLGAKEEALATLTEALAQRGPDDETELTYYELLRTAPAPPDGLEEMIQLVKAAP